MWCNEVYDVLPFPVACLSTRLVMLTVKQNKKWLWIRRNEWISYLLQVCLRVLPKFCFFKNGIMVCCLMSQRKHGLCCMIRHPHGPQNKSLPQLLARLMYYSRKTILALQPPTPVPPTLERKGGYSPSWEGENVVRGGVGEGCQRRSERSPELKAWGVRHGASSLGWMSSRQADSRLKMPLGLALSHPQCVSYSHLLNTHSCVQTVTCTKAGKQVGERPGAGPRSFFL